MGCAPSLLEDDNPSQDKTVNDDMIPDFPVDTSKPESVVTSYIGIDKEIIKVENLSPAPMFGRAIASMRQMRALLEDYSNTGLHGKNIEESEDVQSLFIELGLHRSPNIAAEHEEFIANANRMALERNRIVILQKKLINNDEKLNICSKKVNYLQTLYQQQEFLLTSVFGATYGSEKERQIEQETDTMRNFRDTLAMGVLQWEESEDDLRAGSDCAQKGLISWKSLKKQSIEKKLNFATEARNCLQEAVFLVQRAQESLPGVQFPYCSARELTAVLQALEYIFTDILIEERYQHALQVYENFSQRVTALLRWTTKTLNSSLQKDLVEFDEKVIKVARKLRQERIIQICAKLKIPNNYSENIIDPNVNNLRPSTFGEPTSMYQKPMQPESRYTRENRYGDVLTAQVGPRGLVNLGPALGINQDDNVIFSDPNLQRDFENKLAARRSAMWPSRRMEELRQLTLND